MSAGAPVERCAHTEIVVREVRGQGRGVRVKQCTGCGRQGLPYQVQAQRAAERRTSRIAPITRRRLRNEGAPFAPPPRRRNGWTPDEALPRGERD